MGDRGPVTYRYAWGNNGKRRTMKGRECRVLARGKLSSVLVEFVDNGQREIVSRRSLRRIAVPQNMSGAKP